MRSSLSTIVRLAQGVTLIAAIAMGGCSTPTEAMNADGTQPRNKPVIPIKIVPVGTEITDTVFFGGFSCPGEGLEKRRSYQRVELSRRCCQKDDGETRPISHLHWGCVDVERFICAGTEWVFLRPSGGENSMKCW